MKRKRKYWCVRSSMVVNPTTIWLTINLLGEWVWVAHKPARHRFKTSRAVWRYIRQCDFGLFKVQVIKVTRRAKRKHAGTCAVFGFDPEIALGTSSKCDCGLDEKRGKPQ